MVLRSQSASLVRQKISVEDRKTVGGSQVLSQGKPRKTEVAEKG